MVRTFPGLDSNEEPKTETSPKDAEAFPTKEEFWEWAEPHIINVWESFYTDLQGRRKKNHVYKKMAEELHALGLDLLPKDIGYKLKCLKNEYLKHKNEVETTGKPCKWVHFYRLQTLFSTGQQDDDSSANLDSSSITYSKSKPKSAKNKTSVEHSKKEEDDEEEDEEEEDDEIDGLSDTGSSWISDEESSSSLEQMLMIWLQGQEKRSRRMERRQEQFLDKAMIFLDEAKRFLQEARQNHKKIVRALKYSQTNVR